MAVWSFILPPKPLANAFTLSQPDGEGGWRGTLLALLLPCTGTGGEACCCPGWLLLVDGVVPPEAPLGADDPLLVPGFDCPLFDPAAAASVLRRLLIFEFPPDDEPEPPLVLELDPVPEPDAPLGLGIELGVDQPPLPAPPVGMSIPSGRRLGAV
jgi:hypothetical protein